MTTLTEKYDLLNDPTVDPAELLTFVNEYDSFDFCENTELENSTIRVFVREGKIIGTETTEVAGIEATLMVIRFEQDRMTLRVPLEKAKTLGLRTLSSRKHMDDAILTLKGKAKVKRTMWSRRAQEYEAKIKSGDPVHIAEVVRDLRKRDPQVEQSYSERQMYQAALERLAREFAAIEEIDQETAAVRLEDMMDAA